MFAFFRIMLSALPDFDTSFQSRDGSPAESMPANPTDDPVAQWILIGILSHRCQEMLLHECLPPIQFQLDCFPKLLAYNRRMILFYIVLWKLPFIFYRFMCQIIRRISFLQDSVSHVFLIPEDTFDLIACPFTFAHTGGNLFFVKTFHHYIWIDSFHKRLINPFYHFCLLWVYDQFSVFVRIIAVKTICIKVMDASLKKGSNSPLAVFRDAPALILCKGGQNRKKQFSRRIHRVNIFFFKPNSNS